MFVKSHVKPILLETFNSYPITHQQKSWFCDFTTVQCSGVRSETNDSSNWKIALPWKEPCPFCESGAFSGKWAWQPPA